MYEIQEELKKLPDKPGVYIMKDREGQVIYVGKAVVLRNRVRQYFQASAAHPPKVAVMVSRIGSFEYIVTDSELEALILECNLIKKYRPRYNILLKDDKNYPYIKVTMNEEYPRLLFTRRVEKDGSKYFGPYSSAGAVRETIALIKKIFPVKTCAKKFPRDIGKERPCLNFHINQCLGPCRGEVGKDEYRAMMKDVCSFLGGRLEELIKKLELHMRTAAEAMDYERAASVRDKISSLKRIIEKQKVLSTNAGDQDVIALAREEADACVQIFFIRGGKLIGREHFIFEGSGEIEPCELLTTFIKQFYSAAEFVPGEILLGGEVDEALLIEEWLGEKRSGRARLRFPKRGDRHHLIELVEENARLALTQFKDRLSRGGRLSEEGLSELTSALGLVRAPHRIEAYDISNTGTAEIVASMVVFSNGSQDKKEYRRFRIKSIDRQNDYASMQETLERRFKRAEKEMREGAGQGEGKFSRLPDLILVDGGLGHVNAAIDVLTPLGVDIPVCGMVKDDRHRTRGLVTLAGEIELPKNMPLLRFITAIQDEAHRFALAYNRSLGRKRVSGSVLDEIEGVGSKRRKILLKHFGSVKNIKEAGSEDLLAVEGISRAVAEKVYEYFHG